ncbi:MAG: ParB/RepB/Spo0J family partition protein [Elusimicrobiota bacterium]
MKNKKNVNRKPTKANVIKVNKTVLKETKITSVVDIMVEMVPLKDIVPSKNNPRTDLRSDDNVKEIKLLEESVKQNKCIEVPIIVFRRKDGKFEIIDGERRWRALTEAGITEIPKSMLDIREDLSRVEIAILQAKLDAQRKNWDILDRARLYKSLLEQTDFNQRKLSIVVGVVETYMSEMISVASINPEAIQILHYGEVPSRAYREFARLKNKARELELANEIIKNKLNTTESVAALVTSWNRDEKLRKHKKEQEQSSDTTTSAISEQMQAEAAVIEKNTFIVVEMYKVKIHATTDVIKKILKKLNQYKVAGSLDIEKMPDPVVESPAVENEQKEGAPDNR